MFTELELNVYVLYALISGCLLLSALISVRRARAACWRVTDMKQAMASQVVPPATLACLPVGMRRAAAVMAAQAFCLSPAYTYILQGDTTFRLEALVWLFERNIGLVQHATQNHTGKGRVDATRCMRLPGTNQLVCFFWLLPANTVVKLWAKIQAGLLWFPLLFGFDAFFRLLRTSDAFDQLTEHVVSRFCAPWQPHNVPLLLERMAVDPAWHGRGLGSACLGAALAALPDTQAVVLSTQEARNVTFYGRLGFEVVHTQQFGAEGPEFAFTSWWMVRPARVQS